MSKQDPLHTLGVRLRAAREHAGYSQAELAHLSGVQQPMISALEAGGRLPSLQTLLKLAAALDATLDELAAAAPARPTTDKGLLRLHHLASQMPHRDRRLLLTIAQAIADHRTA